MRKTHPRLRYDQRIVKALSENGELGFAAVMNAAGITSNQAASRGLRRLRREGRVARTVIASYPPRVLYRLTEATEVKAAE
jgi:DNA-binding HxlR family transcriptional regulator